MATHKQWFFEEKDLKRNRIDYTAAVTGGLVLVPEGEGLEALRTDYASMVEGGLLLNASEDFKTIIERCEDIQRRANTIV